MEYDGWYSWFDDCEQGNHDFRVRRRLRLERWRLHWVEVEECFECKIQRPL